jgi:hypothetical protein
MKIEEMADVFLNSANFAPHALLTLAPPSGYALNLKALIKVSKVRWTCQLSYETLRSLFERKFYKTNFISPKRTPPKSPHLLGLISYILCLESSFGIPSIKAGLFSTFWAIFLPFLTKLTKSIKLGSIPRPKDFGNND